MSFNRPPDPRKAFPAPVYPNSRPHLTSRQLDAIFDCKRMFVIQRHDARLAKLHFDLKLEMFGILKSWAVKKGFSDDPTVKRLAVETTEHAKGYGKFEDAIPEGFYGARSVQIFDIGWYELVDHDAIARRENDSDSDSEISDDGDSHRVDPGKGDLDVGRPGVYNIHAHERVLKKQWDRFLPTGGSNGGKLHGGEVNTEGFLWMIKKKIGPNLPHGPAAELCERKNTLWSVLTGRTVPEIIAQEAANWEKIRRSEIFRGMHVDGSLRKGEEEEEARMWVDYEREEALLAAGHGEHGSGASSPASSATPSRGVSRSPGSRSISSSPNVPGQGHRLAGPPPQQSERSLASPASLQLIPHGKRKKSTKVQIRPENDYNTEDSEPEREKRKAAKMGR